MGLTKPTLFLIMKKETKFERKVLCWKSVRNGRLIENERRFLVGVENGELIAIVRGNKKVPIKDCQDGTYTF